MTRRARPVLITVTLTCGVLLAGISWHPGAAAGVEAAIVPFTVVDTGRTSGIREPTQVIVRDAGAWTVLWRAHAGATGRPAPAVDFTRDMVIGVFAGESTARTLAISRIVHESDGLVLWYVLRDTGPLSDGQGLTKASPFQIVRLARLAVPVRFLRAKTPPVVPQP